MQGLAIRFQDHVSTAVISIVPCALLPLECTQAKMIDEALGDYNQPEIRQKFLEMKEGLRNGTWGN